MILNIILTQIQCKDFEEMHVAQEVLICVDLCVMGSSN